MVYPQVPQWTQFFQSCVSRVLLMLVGSPPSVSSVPDKAEANRSLDLVPMQGPSENGPPVLTKEVVIAPKPEGRINTHRPYCLKSFNSKFGCSTGGCSQICNPFFALLMTGFISSLGCIFRCFRQSKCILFWLCSLWNESPRRFHGKITRWP